MYKKQVVSGVVLTRAKVKNNIVRMWNQSQNSERSDWYAEANELCWSLVKNSGNSFIEVAKIAGIIAATSPMKRWDENIKIAKKCWQSGQFSGHTSAMLSKVEQIYNLQCEEVEIEAEIMEILNGNKITAFFLNILYPNRDVSLTMDRHAICIALGLNHLPDDEMPKMTVNQYEFFVQCYRWTAASLGISGTILQSATWVAHRRLKKANK